MRRVTAIKPAGTWKVADAADRVVLDSADRYRRRAVLTGEHGTRALIEMSHPVMLKDGDGLVLDDGSFVQVVGQPEPLLEIAAASGRELARLAWHLGNRHADVQVCEGRLRVRRDHVLEAMLRGLGAAMTAIEAPFDPEAACSREHQGHGHAR